MTHYIFSTYSTSFASCINSLIPPAPPPPPSKVQCCIGAVVCPVYEIGKSTLFSGGRGECCQNAQKSNLTATCLSTFVPHDCRYSNRITLLLNTVSLGLPYSFWGVLLPIWMNLIQHVNNKNMPWKFYFEFFPQEQFLCNHPICIFFNPISKNVL